MVKDWGGKRYNNLNYFLRNKFGEKIYKISLDGGFTCPNRDGKVSKGGCTFCSARGSGDFAGSRILSITEQFEDRKKMIEHFSKYNKIALNASLFKLKEIGLANQFGNLKINAMILMVKNITPIASDSGIKIEGIKYVSPIAINYYDIYLVVKNGNWVLKSIELTVVA